MTHSGLQGPSRLRRIGWLAALGLCAALYVLLHIKVTAVHADVVQAERPKGRGTKPLVEVGNVGFAVVTK